MKRELPPDRASLIGADRHGQTKVARTRRNEQRPGSTRSPPTRSTTEDVVRFDHDGRIYAIYRTADDRYFATDGLCTHESSISPTVSSWTNHRVPEA